MTTAAFHENVSRISRERDRDLVTHATASILRALRDRLTFGEAQQLAAQLPAELRMEWKRGQACVRQPVKMHLDEFLERVMTEVGLPSPREAEWMVRAVFAPLKEQISPGEADDVLAQLPTDLKALWREAGADDRGDRRAR
jgi:uncharacterized protein (DUF2267 family)